jgi:hypothetical protein
MRKFLSYLLPLLALSGVSFAVNAATCSRADVVTAITAAGRNGTVNVPAGSCVWSSLIDITTGLTLQGAGVGSTIITSSGGAQLLNTDPDATAIANSENVTISGFTFDGANSSVILIDIGGASGISGTKPYKYLIIKNNKFQNQNPSSSTQVGAVIQSDPNGNGQIRGVIANNTFDRCNIILRFFSNNDTQEWNNTAFNNFAYGVEDNLYFENNTISYSSSYAGDNPGWVEIGQGGRVVMRYNTWNLTNATSPSEIWDIHGFQNWSGSFNSGQTGTMIEEAYGNSLNNMPQFRWINHRGSWGLFFNNVLTGSGGDVINIYGMSTNLSCPSDISGSGNTPVNYNPVVNNSYFFNNTQNGTNNAATVILPPPHCTVVENSNWWNMNAGCTVSACATGIGQGTVAPTGTCTTGVGYWVASTPTATVNPTVIQNGAFYKCTSTNTWTLYYQPYAYPHPLLGSPTTLPPTGLSGTVNYNVALSCSPSATPGTPTFSVYKGTASGGETLLTSGLASCSYTDTAVSPSTTYFYKMTETIAAVESGFTGEVSDTLPAASSCFLPNLLCAYNGVDIVQWGTIPNFGGLTNNDAVAYDTSYLGHTLFNGTTFTSGVCPGVWCNLSQVTRLTDSASSASSCNYTAGEGGSGEFTVVNTNSTLVGIVCNGNEYLGLFNPSGGNIGHFTPVNSGVFITTDLCQSGGLCTVGLSTQTQDFGSLSFSQTDPSIAFNFGGNSFDITSAFDGLTVFPYQINYAANTPISSAPIGAYKLLPQLVDFKFGLPQFNASEWNNATGYSFGNYVIHTLTAGEMATSGVWATAHLYALGDIVVAQGGTACMYRVITAGGVNTSGSSPTFVNSLPCKNDVLTDAAGNQWRGTNSLAKFLYQNTNTACTVGSPCTSSASFSIGGGHPDLVSTVTEGAGATKNIWTNVGPAYVPANSNQLWQAIAGTSNDCTYIVSGHCFPSKYGLAVSTNTYGDNLTGGGYKKYTGDQGSGGDLMLYDATANAFQHLSTFTGIVTTNTCGTGNGATCGSITTTTVGTAPLTAINNPLGNGQTCPYFIHNMKMNTLGTFARITNQANAFTACNSTQNFQSWSMDPTTYNVATSLQITFGGMNHSAVDTTEMFAYHGGDASPGGFEGGWFTEAYQMNAASSQPKTSIYLKPGANLPGSGLFPTGCNTNTPTINPDCDLANVLDSHLSCVGGCENRAQHGCGTTYNYATFSPIAFNAWQNMETCYPTSTLFQVGSLPSSSAGAVSQFTHTWATGTSNTFSTQFQISEWSQDGNWLFYSTDYACQLGSTTGAAPTVYVSGANHVGFLAKAYAARSPLPSTLTALCGLPWIPGTPYQVGNTADPLESTSVSGGADDVFQVIASCSSGTCQTTSGTGGGVSGPANQPGGSNNQPVCVVAGVNKSCFAQTNAPTSLAAGDTVCDNQNFNGTGSPVTGTQLNSINPSLPYSASCPNGLVWQDLGPQTQRADVLAVQVAGFGVSLSPPILRVVGGGHRIGSGHVIP